MLIGSYKNSWGGWHWYLFTCLVSIIVASTLITSNLFIYPSLTPFYLYLIGISFLILFLGFSVIFKTSEKLSLKWPIIVFLLWFCYVIIHSLYFYSYLSPFSIYILFNGLLLISLYITFSFQHHSLTLLFRVISFLALIESLICISQYLGLINSLNHFFKVTGSWENPNVTAMFLAMSMPANFILVLKRNPIIRYLSIAALSFLIIALFLLQCRTAIVGATIGIVVILNHRYRIRHWLLEKRNRSASMLLILFVSALLIPTIGYLYNKKKDSSESRLLIWKLSYQMILEKPLFGYGYGSFEKNYNLYQSNFLKNGTGTYEEVKHSGFTKMGYDEYLENAVEGGLIGCILFTGLIVTLIFPSVYSTDGSKRQVNNLEVSKTGHNEIAPDKDANSDSYMIAYSGVIIFAVMSMINFSIQAIPVMCLFILYIAILTSDPSYKSFKLNLITSDFLKKGFRWKLLYKPILGVFFCLVGLFAIWFNTARASDSMLNKYAQNEAALGNYNVSLNIYKTLEVKLNSCESFWYSYSNTVFDKRDFNSAISPLTKVLQFTSDPTMYLKLGICYQSMGNYDKALRNYTIAEYIDPNRLDPRYAIMRLYSQLKDTNNLVRTAREIVAIKPKVNSPKVAYYQSQAKLLLTNMGVFLNNQTFLDGKRIIKVSLTFQKPL
jgi:O-antigen polymerase